MRSVLDIPSYTDAVGRFTAEVVKGFYALDPLLGSIPTETTEHAGPIRNVPGQTPLDQQTSASRGEATLSLDTIRNTDVQGYAHYLWELCHSMLEDLTSQILRNMVEITDATGMHLDGGGKPFSPSMVIDMLEKMDLQFDGNGRPIWPTLVVPPDLFQRVQSIKPTPEEERRFSEMIERKRAEYNAKKRTRRLS